MSSVPGWWEEAICVTPVPARREKREENEKAQTSTDCVLEKTASRSWDCPQEWTKCIIQWKESGTKLFWSWVGQIVAVGCIEIFQTQIYSQILLFLIDYKNKEIMSRTIKGNSDWLNRPTFLHFLHLYKQTLLFSLCWSNRCFIHYYHYIQKYAKVSKYRAVDGILCI